MPILPLLFCYLFIFLIFSPALWVTKCCYVSSFLKQIMVFFGIDMKATERRSWIPEDKKIDIVDVLYPQKPLQVVLPMQLFYVSRWIIDR